LVPANNYSPFTLVLRIEVSCCIAPCPADCVTPVEESLEVAVVRAERKSCATPESCPSAFWVDEIDDDVQPVEIAGEGDRLGGASAEGQANVGNRAGLGLFRGFDEVGLHAHLLVAHGVRKGSRRD
jgi:hypothetical protein